MSGKPSEEEVKAVERGPSQMSITNYKTVKKNESLLYVGANTDAFPLTCPALRKKFPPSFTLTVFLIPITF